MISPEAARWLADRRGIRRETLEAFGVTSDGPDTLIFPYGEARKYRKGFEKDDRKFWWDPPTSAGQVPFLPPGFAPQEHMLLTEGETDTMALWQHAPPEARTGIVGLSGLNAWKDRYAEELFGAAKTVWVALDNDDPYGQAKAQNDAAWRTIKNALGRKAKRIVLPQGIKDVAEFFQTYEWPAFRVLMREAAKPVRHYPRLDLAQPVPPTEWLIEDLLVAGEVTVLAGDSGVGKSFITMAMALAVAGDDDSFLGLRVKRHGRVLYVDEENSPQLVLSRLNALGLSAKHRERIDYINYGGVRLDEEPELLLEEAVELEPTLIVIDSQSRVALNTEENSNTEVTRLFQRGIVPLARQTGAAVAVLHHTPKDKRGPRGAGAIKAAADQAIEIIQATDKAGNFTGTLNLFPSKPRRLTTHLSMRIVGDVEHDGYVRVERAEEEQPF